MTLSFTNHHFLFKKLNILYISIIADRKEEDIGNTESVGLPLVCCIFGASTAFLLLSVSVFCGITLN